MVFLILPFKRHPAWLESLVGQPGQSSTDIINSCLVCNVPECQVPQPAGDACSGIQSYKSLEVVARQSVGGLDLEARKASSSKPSALLAVHPWAGYFSACSHTVT